MAVLLIEDDDDLRATMAEILVDDGHRVTAVATIDEGRRYLAAFLPTLIVLDGRLNGMSARSLLLEIDLRHGDARPPMLLVSGSWGSSELAEEFGVTLITKPFDCDRFLDEVHRLAREPGSGAHVVASTMPPPSGDRSHVATLGMKRRC
jgi:DNA-binding response OmpR family regulator